MRTTLLMTRAAAACGALALLATGCAGSSGGVGSGGATSGGANPSTSSAGGSQSPDNSLASLVPADVKADGVLKVGTDPTYAPSEFLATNGKTVQGFDIDLFNAVAQKLGLKAQFVPSVFGTIIAGIGSGKYEVGVSSFTINADREKQADMVSYFRAGTQWATMQGNPKGIQPDSACGHAIAVQKDTVQVPDAQDRSTTCTQAGKPAIKLDQYQGQDQATASVVSGKDDAMLADSPVVAYAVKQTGGKLAFLGDIYDSAPYGFVTKKGSGLSTAIQKAVQAIIDDGTYQQVLNKWGVSQGAVDTSAVNPPVS